MGQCSGRNQRVRSELFTAAEAAILHKVSLLPSNIKPFESVRNTSIAPSESILDLGEIKEQPSSKN